MENLLVLKDRAPPKNLLARIGEMYETGSKREARTLCAYMVSNRQPLVMPTSIRIQG